MNAQVIKRKPRKRTIRAIKTGAATDAIGKLDHGAEIFGLTMGQFSLIDLLCAIVEQTGPAHITLATWTAASTDLTRASAMLQSSAILSMRFIVDRSFLTRVPQYCADMRFLFGDSCIRTGRTHAKFATIHNDEWTIALRTSMNLNHNARSENFELSDDPELFAFLNQVCDDIFNEVDEGDMTRSPLPLLENIENIPLDGRASASAMPIDGLRRPTTGTP